MASSVACNLTGGGELGDRSAWFNDFFQAVRTTHAEPGAFVYGQAEVFIGDNHQPRTGSVVISGAGFGV